MQELVGIGQDLGPSIGTLEADLDPSLGDGGGEGPEGAGGHVGDRDGPQGEHPGPRGGEEVLDDGVEPGDLAQDELDVHAPLVPLGEPATQVLHAGRDPGQGVSDLVRDAGGEPPQGRQAVQLSNPLLHAAHVREVGERGHGAPRAALGVTERGRVHLDRDRGAVLAADDVLGGRSGPGPAERAQERLLPAFGAADLLDGLGQGGLARGAEDGLRGAVPGQDLPFAVHRDDAQGHALDHVLPEARLEVQRFVQAQVHAEGAEGGHDGFHGGVARPVGVPGDAHEAEHAVKLARAAASAALPLAREGRARDHARSALHRGSRARGLSAAEPLLRHFPAHRDRAPRASAPLPPGVGDEDLLPFPEREPPEPLGIHVAQRDASRAGLELSAGARAPESELGRIPPPHPEPEAGLVQRPSQVLDQGSERVVGLATRNRERDQLPHASELDAGGQLSTEVRFEVV